LGELVFISVIKRSGSSALAPSYVGALPQSLR